MKVKLNRVPNFATIADLRYFCNFWISKMFNCSKFRFPPLPYKKFPHKSCLTTSNIHMRNSFSILDKVQIETVNLRNSSIFIHFYVKLLVDDAVN